MARLRDQLMEDELSLVTKDGNTSAGPEAKASKTEAELLEAKATQISTELTWAAAMNDPATLMA